MKVTNIFSHAQVSSSKNASGKRRCQLIAFINDQYSECSQLITPSLVEKIPLICIRTTHSYFSVINRSQLVHRSFLAHHSPQVQVTCTVHISHDDCAVSDIISTTTENIFLLEIHQSSSKIFYNLSARSPLFTAQSAVTLKRATYIC